MLENSLFDVDVDVDANAHCNLLEDAAQGSKKKVSGESLLYVSFNLKVWSGTTTVQTGLGEGSRSMVRNRIVPSECLKPFINLRRKVQKFCDLCGEKYLNGYVFMHKDLGRLQAFFQGASELFFKERDQTFSQLFMALKKDREAGIVPEGCAPHAQMPALEQALRWISFEYAIFPMADVQKGSMASIDSFLDSLTLKIVDEAAELHSQLQEGTIPTEGFLCRCQSLAERLAHWSRLRNSWQMPCMGLKVTLTALGAGNADSIKALKEALQAISQLKPTASEVVVNPSDKVDEIVLSASVEKAIEPAPEDEEKPVNKALTFSPPSVSDEKVETDKEEQATEDDSEDVERWDCSIETMLSRGKALFIP